MNEIRISYDLTRAVRISDGLRLVAVPDCEDTRCEGCVVPNDGPDQLRRSCTASMALYPSGRRKCRGPGTRLITWRPA